jgi:hypothetical protein
MLFVPYRPAIGGALFLDYFVTKQCNNVTLSATKGPARILISDTFVTLYPA